MAKDDDIAPIPGPRKQVRVAENAAATDRILTDEVVISTEAIRPNDRFGECYADGTTPTWV